MVISRILLLFSLVAASLVALSRTVPTNDGQPHVVGSPQPIVAASGDSVVLPCHLEPSINVEETVVEWTRQDRSHVTFVHIYRDHVEVMDMKTASYRGRTALFIEELKHGNISLRITEVTEADEGSYRCFIPTLRSPVKDSTVRLVITKLEDCNRVSQNSSNCRSGKGVHRSSRDGAGPVPPGCTRPVRARRGDRRHCCRIFPEIPSAEDLCSAATPPGSDRHGAVMGRSVPDPTCGGSDFLSAWLGKPLGL